MQEIEILPSWQTDYAQTRICDRKWDPKILRDFELQMDHPIPAWRPYLVVIDEKKKNVSSNIFCHLSEPQRETPKRKRKDKCLHLTRELKNMLNMKVTVIPNVVGALGMEEESRPSRQQHYLDQLEYWKEFWRLIATQASEKTHLLKC